jgi:NitT/TauT family transport system permease protein
LSLAWTIPVGVAIGLNPRISRWAQPLAQIVAAVPATALFPVFVLSLLRVTHTLEVPAILLMMSGIQWYLLFNIIAGASAIPRDLRYTASLMRMRGRGWWREFVLPSLFPFLITGTVTAFAGAWNACIVAEYVTFQEKVYDVFGVGALISHATNSGDYPLLLGSTLCLIVAVVSMNRLVWRRFFQLSEDRYRME